MIKRIKRKPLLIFIVVALNSCTTAGNSMFHVKPNTKKPRKSKRLALKSKKPPISIKMTLPGNRENSNITQPSFKFSSTSAKETKKSLELSFALGEKGMSSISINALFSKNLYRDQNKKNYGAQLSFRKRF